MDRGECEKKLLDLLEQAYEIFKGFNPEGNHLTMFATDNGHCALGYKVAPWESCTIIDGFKGMDGHYRFGK